MQVAIFSKDSDALDGVKTRLAQMGYLTKWFDVADFGPNIPELMSCEAVIVDEVDAEFRQREDVWNLEEWLIRTEGAPPRLFLESDTDYHLDSLAKQGDDTAVHHFHEELGDEVLSAMCSRNRRRDPQLAFV
jgi:hypothetical protein